MLNTLKVIQSRDPEGGETEPTDRDRARFRRWVIDTYGYRVASVYFTTAWEV